MREAAAWRVRRVLGDARVDSAWVAVAKRWRPTLKRTVFIGVTGSAGKTTTKELLFGILSASKRGVANPASLNVLPEVAKTVMRVRPSHDFCVVELSEAVPGVMAEHLSLLKPSVGIVTVVQNDHVAAFGSVDALAQEMSRLVQALPSSGTAVLNADDPRVLAMSAGCHCKVLTYGVSPQAHLRAQDITSAWPDRLQMTLLWQGQRVALKTQLCGTHWLAAVLGAVGGALASGLTLQECATAMASVNSFEGRMQPITTPDGITFIRDDFKAPLWTLNACFDFMKAAQAKRKIIVIGTLSDYGTGTGASKKYADVARLAQDIADITVFVGPWASSVFKARRAERGDALKVFAHVRDATEFINSTSRAGDLILLKGTNKQDHLLRIILARSNEIACWRDNCAEYMFCSECPERMKPSGAPLLDLHHPTATGTQTAASPKRITLDPKEQIIVGLGNPGDQFINTPHNVGYAVLDRMVDSQGLTWQKNSVALIARGAVHGQPVCLVKIQSPMNLTGPGLKTLSDAMHFNPEDCILIFDDMDLTIGTVKTRQNGSAGGHRGVASILETYQTDAIRRVKVGVAPVGAKIHRAEVVLKPFGADELATLGPAMALAEARVMEMLTIKSKSQ